MKTSFILKLRNWLFILFSVYFFTSCLLVKAQDSKNIDDGDRMEASTGDGDSEVDAAIADSSDMDSDFDYTDIDSLDTLPPPRVPTKKELERIQQVTEVLARRYVREKFEKIDRERKYENMEEKRKKKIEKIVEKRKKRGKDISAFLEDEKLREELREQRKNQKQTRWAYDEDDSYYEENMTEREKMEDFYDSNPRAGLDSALLFKRMVELGFEEWTKRHIKDAKKGRRGYKFLKIKIPDCYYLNKVVYRRDTFQFEFTYQYDFFIHYFEHRFHHKRRFYDLRDAKGISLNPAATKRDTKEPAYLIKRDSTNRVISSLMMKLVGNTRYRRTDLNKVIDSIGVILGRSVEEDFDLFISELNLEYIATGDIKFKYKNKNQKRVHATVKPSNIDRNSLGDITFYTRDNKKVIEHIDASLFNEYLPTPEIDYMDSIMSVSVIGSTLVDTSQIMHIHSIENLSPTPVSIPNIEDAKKADMENNDAQQVQEVITPAPEENQASPKEPEKEPEKEKVEIKEENQEKAPEDASPQKEEPPPETNTE